jgi:hypothetical protein
MRSGSVAGSHSAWRATGSAGARACAAGCRSSRRARFRIPGPALAPWQGRRSFPTPPREPPGRVRAELQKILAAILHRREPGARRDLRPHRSHFALDAGSPPEAREAGRASTSRRRYLMTAACHPPALRRQRDRGGAGHGSLSTGTSSPKSGRRVAHRARPLDGAPAPLRFTLIAASIPRREPASSRIWAS